jgi:hypothetical protein
MQLRNRSKFFVVAGDSSILSLKKRAVDHEKGIYISPLIDVKDGSGMNKMFS